MALIPVAIPPGLKTETPSRTSDPAWRDCDYVRFQAGQPEKMGGWVQSEFGMNIFEGIPRTIFRFRDNTGYILTAVGTNEKLYVLHDAVYDITPLRETQVITNGFACTSGSTTVTVTDTTHGSNTGDWVTFSGFSDANLTDSEVNANHQITKVDANTYTFEVTTAATGTASSMGGSVTAKYEIAIGANAAVPRFGWGAGPYNSEAWNTARSTSAIVTDIRVWSLDNAGDVLVATHEAGEIYRWSQATEGFSGRATEITTAPNINEALLVTSPDRHLVALGTTMVSTQDKMQIRWADQESITDWTPTSVNTAGDHLLVGGSRIITARRAQNTNLIWTDTSLHTMQFIGPDATFGFNEIAANCGLTGKNAVTTVHGIPFWMGYKDFYNFDGVVRPMPCDVHRYVYDDFDAEQAGKVIAGSNKEFHEVIWFYPSTTGGGEIDRYVIFNYGENLWYFGTMARTAWLDANYEASNPIACDEDGTLYLHENGVNANGSAITAYIESSEWDIENGDHFYFMRRYIPDMVISAGSVDVIFKTRRYPHSTQATDTTGTVTSSTEKLDTRIRSRQLAIRFQSDAVDDDWRAGLGRIDVRMDGRR